MKKEVKWINIDEIKDGEEVAFKGKFDFVVGTLSIKGNRKTINTTVNCTTHCVADSYTANWPHKVIRMSDVEDQANEHKLLMDCLNDIYPSFKVERKTK